MDAEPRSHWKDQIERRGSPRVSLFSPAFFSGSDKDRPQGWGWITDIGINGMELMTHFPLYSGEAVVVTFSLDSSLTLSDVCGSVVHLRTADGYTYAGIEFAKDFDRMVVKNALEKLLEETLKQSHDPINAIAKEN